MAAIETNYLMQLTGQGADNYITSAIPAIGSTSKDVDLSEMHMAWFASMTPSLEQRFTVPKLKDIRKPTPNEALNAGGFAMTAITTLARGCGPVTEQDFPYISNYVDTAQIRRDVTTNMGYDPDNLSNLTEDQRTALNAAVKAEIARQTDEWCNANIVNKKPDDNTRVLRLWEASYANPSHGDKRTVMFRENSDSVKRLIMNKGALTVSYSARGYVYNGAYNYYSQNPKNNRTNHSVAIIGWDDDYPTANFSSDNLGSKIPSSPGAWLIRNSWGSDVWGHIDGYFWMSYEQMLTQGTAYTIAPVDPNLTIYTHSELG